MITHAPPKRLTLLGSTGSIGTQTLDIVARYPDRLDVVALAANSSVTALSEQAERFKPEFVAVADDSQAAALQNRLHGSGIKVLSGTEGLCELAALPKVDIVVGAASGIAGLRPVLAALEAGKALALANKETLVAAGGLAMATAARTGARILPVDSEHSAIFQCLEAEVPIESIVLTASGGPFRSRDVGTFSAITPEEALDHPNWSMGPKVTIDSATMMNKGLEVIEAKWLFDLRPDQIQVAIHPQSIVHSMVVFADGSTKAQIGLPSMRVPIQYALSYPERWEAPDGRVDWQAGQTLEFLPPDMERFPCLALAFEAMEQGGAAPVALNAANEAAVALFLNGQIAFTDIAQSVEQALDELGSGEAGSYEEIIAVDAAARTLVEDLPRHSVM